MASSLEFKPPAYEVPPGWSPIKLPHRPPRPPPNNKRETKTDMLPPREGPVRRLPARKKWAQLLDVASMPLAFDTFEEFCQHSAAACAPLWLEDRDDSVPDLNSIP